MFLRTRNKQILSTTLCPPEQADTLKNDHAAHRSRIARFDIVKPHVALTCVSGFEWIVLREDFLAR